MHTNRYQVRGRIKEAKGKIKVVAGRLLGDNKLQAKGALQSALGRVQARFGDLKQRLKRSSKNR